MSCRQIVEFLGDYLNGDLPLRTRLQFALHLTLCSHCRQYLASYKHSILLAKSSGLQSDLEACQPIPDQLVKTILASRPDSGEHQLDSSSGRPPDFSSGLDKSNPEK